MTGARKKLFSPYLCRTISVKNPFFPLLIRTRVFCQVLKKTFLIADSPRFPGKNCLSPALNYSQIGRQRGRIKKFHIFSSLHVCGSGRRSNKSFFLPPPLITCQSEGRGKRRKGNLRFLGNQNKTPFSFLIVLQFGAERKNITRILSFFEIKV